MGDDDISRADEDKGLDADGFLAREGSLGRVPAPFGPLVDDVRRRVPEVFGPRLHSAYLYGSLPRGTAVPGRSDLDLLIALHPDASGDATAPDGRPAAGGAPGPGPASGRAAPPSSAPPAAPPAGPASARGSAPPCEPSDADRSAASALEAELDAAHDVIDGAGILLVTVERLLSARERHDLGWFVACLCTPLIGEDLGARLPRYRPGTLLARETNGSLDARLPRWRRQNAAAAEDPAERTRLSRAYARVLVRTAFTLVMPRWGGWTSDLERSAEIFARYYPERGDQVRAAAVVARFPVGDPAVLTEYADDLAPWLAGEYLRVHGPKTWPET
ncbi:nucleotidyltransferase domain-containing protein [Streptomyces fuscigenes]|uniref:nucleotidyltransferase domain-containing protein n=1 Tax=Streptomyces fuscigenes TaxID=1528880 RepID=UPI001F2AB175|nr:nucleotidyltransferase domain-containing protein [Streptomyces fuscigenes]MCF3961263.1 nucleotidyltransferase domain-containing protein [Streptomyces fuscigenes]